MRADVAGLGVHVATLRPRHVLFETPSPVARRTKTWMRMQTRLAAYVVCTRRGDAWTAEEGAHFHSTREREREAHTFIYCVDGRGRRTLSFNGWTVEGGAHFH
jgi:hypothetical protein